MNISSVYTYKLVIRILVNQKGTRHLFYESGSTRVIRDEEYMRKELRHIDVSNLQKALRKSGYRRTKSSSGNEHWRKGRYHLVIEERSGKVLLEIHEDLPHHLGVMEEGEQLKREIREIIKRYRGLREKKGPPLWS